MNSAASNPIAPIDNGRSNRSRSNRGGVVHAPVGMPSMPCPNCLGPTTIRNSRAITRLYREIRFQCNDPECGFTFAAGLEALRALSPSGRPNPRLTWPAKPAPVRPEPYDPPLPPLDEATWQP